MQEKNFFQKKTYHILKSVFGYDSFRPGQEEIIDKVLAGRDTLAVMPTGGGKSLCYQIPALVLEGVTVVVSPLISLMQDQVGALKEAGVNAVFLNSSLDLETYRATVSEIKSGAVKLIYLSPEGLNTERVKNIFREGQINVSCLTIDEAHCVSEWGHDFRPDYLEIACFREEFKNAVCLALTATATSQVREDIVNNLKLKNPAILVSSFNRKNIFLDVQPRTDGTGQVLSFINEHKDESGIIYCLSRKEVDQITGVLQANGISALNYHAGLSDAERTDHQNKFIRDQVDVMVATVAFGMGINKPNVRYVIHYALPKSLEEYYQEIGRAGRDGLDSCALLLYSAGDIHRIRYFFRDKDEDENFKSEKLLRAMTDYAQARICRRRVLLKYFGEDYNPPAPEKSSGCEENRSVCCDICSGGGMPNRDVTVPAQKFLSCVYRVDQRFGAAYIIDILVGANTEKIRKNGHNFLSTYGIGCELTKQAWFELVDAMENAGLIRRVGEYNVVNVTSLGREVLECRDKIELPVRIKFDGGKKASLALPKAVLHKKDRVFKSVEAASLELVEKLKKWRRRKAEEMNVPPYMIFGDRTLVDLANKKPVTRGALYTVSGIGEVKAQKFGDEIISIIRSK